MSLGNDKLSSPCLMSMSCQTVRKMSSASLGSTLSFFLTTVAGSVGERDGCAMGVVIVGISDADGAGGNGVKAVDIGTVVTRRLHAS